jgi:hypothetical protein
MIGVLSIDPGYAKRKHGCACALSYDGRIVKTWDERPTPWQNFGRTGTIHRVVIERPQQDGRSRTVPPEHLIGLAWNGALLAGLYCGVYGALLTELTVHEWKGSEPKSAQHARLWAVLDPREREVLGGLATERAIYAARERGALKRWASHPTAYYPASFNHDALDAAALNAVYSGRLQKVG